VKREVKWQVAGIDRKVKAARRQAKQTEKRAAKAAKKRERKFKPF
jgi:hypothetical protein